jgi:hypothetical protein
MLWALGDGPTGVPVEYEGTGVFPATGLFDTAMAWDVRGRFADGKRFRFRGPGEDRTTFIGERGTIAVSRSGIRLLNPPSLKDEKLRPGEKRLAVDTNHGFDFIEGIRTNGRPASTIEAAVFSDTVSHLSDIAIRAGRKIRWDPFAERIVGDPAASRMLYRPMRAPWRLG